MAVSLLSNNEFSYYEAIERNQWKPLESASDLSPWQEPVSDNTISAPWFWDEDELQSEPISQSRSADRTALTSSAVRAIQASTQNAPASDEEYKLSDHESHAIMKISADRVRQIIQTPCVAYRRPKQSLDTLKSFSACAVLLALAVVVSQPKLPDLSSVKSSIKSKLTRIAHVLPVKSMPAPAIKTSAKVASVVAVSPRAARTIFYRPVAVKPAQVQVQAQSKVPAQAPWKALLKATPFRSESLIEYTGPSSMTGLTVPHRHAYQTATVSE
ncbi:MAG TPA: hypothetical protein V6C97_05935 [Oculatellaceae cyanobacterium]